MSACTFSTQGCCQNDVIESITFHKDIKTEPDYEDIVTEEAVTYQVVIDDSAHCGRFLISSDGYFYNVASGNEFSTVWSCGMRSQKFSCLVTVIQEGVKFYPGTQDHIHPPDLKQCVDLQVTAEIKQYLKEDSLATIRDVVSEVLDGLSPDQRTLAPNRCCLEKSAQSIKVEYSKIPSEEGVTYTLLEDGNERGGPLLISSNGYSYVVKVNHLRSVQWRCSIRNRKVVCVATVLQKGDEFFLGSANHVHPPDSKLPVRVFVTSEMKYRIREQPHISSAEIVEMILSNLSTDDRLIAPKENLLIRSANNYKAKLGLTGPVRKYFTKYSVLEPKESEPKIPLSLYCDETPLKADPDLNNDQAQEVTYRILEEGNIRGGPLLLSSTGYTYVLKNDISHFTVWRCTLRNKNLNCNAIVGQKGDQFFFGHQEHKHPPDSTIALKASLSSTLRHLVREMPSVKTKEIVERTLANYSPEERAFLPKYSVLVRTANKYRSKVKLEPTTEKSKLIGPDPEEPVSKAPLLNLCDYKTSNAHSGVLSNRKEKVTYDVLEDGNERGGPLLVSSNGYSYCIKSASSFLTQWRCSVRNRRLTCSATINQKGNRFHRSTQNHIHPADMYLPIRMRVTTRVKRLISQQPSVCTKEIVKRVLEDLCGNDRSLAPTHNWLEKVALRFRSKIGSSEPIETKNARRWNRNPPSQ